jgi:hypothetical protein
MRRTRKWVLVTLSVLAGCYLLLLIPDSAPPPPQVASARPFIWDRDGTWNQLESLFLSARSQECPSLAEEIEDRLLRTDGLLQRVEEERLAPDSQVLTQLEAEFFALSPLVAACPDKIARYVDLQTGLRTAVKRQSRHWDMALRPAREAVYRALYGSRTAVEEVLLQAGVDAVASLQPCAPEPSATPSAKVLGMTVHSGDMLLSRGTAPTSALIARGSDFPGNFSHVALVHVDPKSSLASIVEAHIERGVVVSSLRDYLEDRKARVTLLRVRADLPELMANPQLPHDAATYALNRAKSTHVPYDFAMDSRDASRLYCSEVAYDAYLQQELKLWTAQSTVSAPGLAGWLALFGVRHLTTLGPSDLEYDPKVTVVAEWRDPDALWRDHLDNAAVDALLEQAEEGMGLDYCLLMLPFARIAKALSWAAVALGYEGPVPEGMSASAALRNQAFSRLQLSLVESIQAGALKFHRDNGYRAPYWKLVGLARDALAKLQGQ